MRRRSGFTIIEILIALLIASVMIIVLLTFFGDTFQKFVQHEDTLTSAREMHRLLEYLRKDIEVLVPGVSRDLGTTFPQQVAHIYHSIDSDKLITFHWTKDQPEKWFENTDPVEGAMRPKVPPNALRTKYEALSGACSWSIYDENGDDRKIFTLSLRTQAVDDSGPILIQYIYDASVATITRVKDDKKIVFAKGAVHRFSAIPVFDFYYVTPDTIILNKMFIEIAIGLKAEKDGGRIEKRELTIQTKACPRLLHNAVSSRWSN